MEVVFLYVPFTEREPDMRPSDASAVSFGKSSCGTQLSPLSNEPQNFCGRGPEGRPPQKVWLPAQQAPTGGPAPLLRAELGMASCRSPLAYSLTTDAPERVLLNEVFPGLRFQNSHSSALLILTPCFIPVL